MCYRRREQWQAKPPSGSSWWTRLGASSQRLRLVHPQSSHCGRQKCNPSSLPASCSSDFESGCLRANFRLHQLQAGRAGIRCDVALTGYFLTNRYVMARFYRTSTSNLHRVHVEHRFGLGRKPDREKKFPARGVTYLLRWVRSGPHVLVRPSGGPAPRTGLDSCPADPSPATRQGCIATQPVFASSAARWKTNRPGWILHQHWELF